MGYGLPQNLASRRGGLISRSNIHIHECLSLTLLLIRLRGAITYKSYALISMCNGCKQPVGGAWIEIVHWVVLVMGNQEDWLFNWGN